MYVILVYDIKTDEAGAGQKVWRKVFGKCKQYLHHVQNSVFQGVLSKAQLFELQCEVKKIIRDELDSVIIFSSGNENWMTKVVLGVEINNTSNIL